MAFEVEMDDAVIVQEVQASCYIQGNVLATAVPAQHFARMRIAKSPEQVTSLQRDLQYD